MPLTRSDPIDAPPTSRALYRVLVIGAGGAFGTRLCELLSQSPSLALILMGRDRRKLEALAVRLRSTGATAAIHLAPGDWTSALSRTLASQKPHLIIHTAGPFQGQDYTVARAAIAAGANYLDLADGRDFVAGFGALDEAARGANVFALTGASSVPALSGAVIDHLTQDLTEIGEIETNIAPGNRAPKGVAVVAAILGSLGQPFTHRRAEEDALVHGWSGGRRLTFSLPGHAPLRRRVSPVDVPDLAVFAQRYPSARTIRFGAGLELGVLHRALELGAAGVRAGLLPGLRGLAPAAKHVAGALDSLGTDEGGMLCRVTGRRSDGRWVERTWTLIAESGHGPYIPAIAAALLARRASIGRGPPPGAGPAVGQLALPAFEHAFAALDITAGTREEPLPEPLFARILGPAYPGLAGEIARLHDVNAPLRATGEARVDRGGGPIGALIGALFSFPQQAERTPVTVIMEPHGGGETWTRRFGERSFVSHLSAVPGRTGLRLAERFGPFRFDMDVSAGAEGLSLHIRRARIFGLPWPLVFSPRIKAQERVEDGRFVFDVRIELPVFGLLVHYRGSLAPADQVSARTSPPASREERPEPRIDRQAWT